jgi:hypothetical protein
MLRDENATDISEHAGAFLLMVDSHSDPKEQQAPL